MVQADLMSTGRLFGCRHERSIPIVTFLKPGVLRRIPMLEQVIKKSIFLIFVSSGKRNFYIREPPNPLTRTRAAAYRTENLSA